MRFLLLALASLTTLQALLEIEEISAKNTGFPKAELQKLEISCRLNYANAKSKIADYDIAIIQAKEVLKIEENKKAYFRLGHAYFNLKKWERAVLNLKKALTFDSSKTDPISN